MTKVGKSLEIPLNANVAEYVVLLLHAAKWQVEFTLINPSMLL